MPLHGDSRIVQCDYASSDSSNLRKHMKRHKTGKIYLLPISIYHFCFSVIREVLEMLSHQSETQVARLGNEWWRWCYSTTTPSFFSLAKFWIPENVIFLGIIWFERLAHELFLTLLSSGPWPKLELIEDAFATWSFSIREDGLRRDQSKKLLLNMGREVGRGDGQEALGQTVPVKLLPQQNSFSLGHWGQDRDP